MRIRAGNKYLLISFVFLILNLFSSPNYAQVTVTIVSPVKADIDIVFPDPNAPDLTNDSSMEIEFEAASNLSVACLGVTATLLNSAQQLLVEARLPGAADAYNIDPAYPVLIHVNPPTSCGLSFDSDAHFEIHTDELTFVSPTPYRLMKAPTGGAFANITSNVLPGSIRTRGSGGRFSEFIIVKAVNISPQTEAGLAFAALASRIDQIDVPLSASLTLKLQLNLARAAFNVAQYPDAIARLNTISIDLEGFRASGFPDTWLSSLALVNTEGEIQALIGALKYAIQVVDDND